MRTLLRLKLNSLATEAQAARREANKLLVPKRDEQNCKYAKTDREGKLLTYTYTNPRTGKEVTKTRWVVRKDHPLRMDIMNHRKNVIRPAARLHHIAASFLRGTPYQKIEGVLVDAKAPDFTAVRKIAIRFGVLPQTLQDKVALEKANALLEQRDAKISKGLLSYPVDEVALSRDFALWHVQAEAHLEEMRASEKDRHKVKRELRANLQAARNDERMGKGP